LYNKFIHYKKNGPNLGPFYRKLLSMTINRRYSCLISAVAP
jgi:hypothetical protein